MTVSFDMIFGYPYIGTMTEKKSRVKRNGKPFQFYLSDTLKRRLRRKAVKSGLSLGAWIRMVLLKAAKEKD